MRHVIYVPLENLEQRYTVMANHACSKFADEVVDANIETPPAIIKRGQFLDIIDTSKFKGRQLFSIASMMELLSNKKSYTFFFADIFHPAVPFTKYMSELLGLNVKVVGFNYAGWADPNDFVRECGVWCKYFDISCNSACDVVFVGSQHHKQNVESLLASSGCPIPKIVVSGYAWSSSWIDDVRAAPICQRHEKMDYVIWPHRWCREKGVSDLFEFAKQNEDMKIVVTSCGKITSDGSHVKQVWSNGIRNIVFMQQITKRDYYQTMSRARYYLSTGYQETFGYTIQEAIYHRCRIAVPNRACYPEMVQERCVYNDISDARRILLSETPMPERYATRWDSVAEKCFKTAKR